jgi:DNA-binding transcriptional ArsR family regulator
LEAVACKGGCEAQDVTRNHIEVFKCLVTAVSLGLKHQSQQTKAGHGAEPSLARLVTSGRCGAVNSKKYQAELTDLVSHTSGKVDIRSEAEVFKALSDELRLKMVYMLLERELCECEIDVALSLKQPTASHHLSILERAGAITKTRRGRWVFYKASRASVGKFLSSAEPSALGRRLDLRIQGT